MVAQTILIYGPGSGLGKSTVSRSLTDRLNAQGQSAVLLVEEVVPTHPTFQRYIDSIRAGQADDTAALTESCRRFVRELNGQRAQIVVLDSILPCWDWLYSAGCTHAEVTAFSQTLTKMLEPLRPVLVFVEGDLDTALARAIQDRGEEWALDLAELRTGQKDVKALRSYFRNLRAGAERQLAEWPYPVIRINTVAGDLPFCLERVLSASSPSAGT